jgi:hypothetical protein
MAQPPDTGHCARDLTQGPEDVRAIHTLYARLIERASTGAT